MVREQIYAALFAKLSAIPGLVTTSRKFVHWADVPAASQPALYQTQRKEQVAQNQGLPAASTMLVDVVIYAHSNGDPSIAPSTYLNPLVDAVLAALAPDNVMTNKQTLGGLVQHAWVEGAIETDEGVLGDQAVAIIPINIKAV